VNKILSLFEMDERGGRILPRLSDKTKSRLKKGAALAAALGYLYYTGDNPKQIPPKEVAKRRSEERRKENVKKLSLKKKDKRRINPQVVPASERRVNPQITSIQPEQPSSKRQITSSEPEEPSSKRQMISSEPQEEPLPSFEELEDSVRTDPEDERFTIPPSRQQRIRKKRIKKFNRLLKEIGIKPLTPPGMRPNALTVTPEQTGQYRSPSQIEALHDDLEDRYDDPMYQIENVVEELDRLRASNINDDVDDYEGYEEDGIIIDKEQLRRELMEEKEEQINVMKNELRVLIKEALEKTEDENDINMLNEIKQIYSL
jgi:hypothetical protein